MLHRIIRPCSSSSAALFHSIARFVECLLHIDFNSTIQRWLFIWILSALCSLLFLFFLFCFVHPFSHQYVSVFLLKFVFNLLYNIHPYWCVRSECKFCAISWHCIFVIGCDSSSGITGFYKWKSHANRICTHKHTHTRCVHLLNASGHVFILLQFSEYILVDDLFQFFFSSV